jgi:hypothetical protein
MQVRIRVNEMSDGSFDLLTDRGHRIGGRLLSVPPKKGESMPVIPVYTETTEGCFTDRDEAYAAAMEWGIYLKHAWTHRQKTKNRSRE